MRARVATFTGAAAFALTTLAPPGGLVEAQACGGGGNNGLEGLQGLAYVAGAVAVTFVALDVGFATYDIAKAANHQRASDGMAVAEMLVMLPQSLLFFTLASGGRSERAMWFGIGMVPTLMAIHGAGTLAAPRNDDPHPTGTAGGAGVAPKSSPSFGLSGAF